VKIFALTILSCAALFAAEPCAKPGDVCRLKGSGIKLADGEWTPTASTGAAYDQLKRSLRMNDMESIKELVLAGKVFMTASGDSVRVLDRSIWNGYTAVQFISGKYKGLTAVTTPALARKSHQV
jgi:hypothetical protein